jgi:O-antigen/teichoic acid export membrane protein
VLGKLLSVLLLVSFLAYRGHAVWSAPNFARLGRHAPSVLGHHMLNLVTQAPGLILPFLVTIAFSADVNAAFYAAWMIFSVILLVPASLTTVLFTMGSAQPTAIAARMRLSLWLCVVTSVVAGVGFFLVSDLMLGFFGPSYASIGGPVLQILGLGVLAVALKYHYIAVQRLKGRMVRAAMLLGAGGVVELALAIWGAQLGGLSGFAWGWVCAAYLEAVCLVPSVLRATRSDCSPEHRIAAAHRVLPLVIDRNPSWPRYTARAGRASPANLRRRG